MILIGVNRVRLWPRSRQILIESTLHSQVRPLLLNLGQMIAIYPFCTVVSSLLSGVYDSLSKLCDICQDSLNDSFFGSSSS